MTLCNVDLTERLILLTVQIKLYIYISLLLYFRISLERCPRIHPIIFQNIKHDNRKIEGNRIINNKVIVNESCIIRVNLLLYCYTLSRHVYWRQNYYAHPKRTNIGYCSLLRAYVYKHLNVVVYSIRIFSMFQNNQANGMPGAKKYK